MEGEREIERYHISEKLKAWLYFLVVAFILGVSNSYQNSTKLGI